MKRKGKYVQLELPFKPWDDEEIWKDIPNYEGLYQASNLGRIKSLDRWVDRNGKLVLRKSRILKPALDTYGYPTISLCKNGKAKNYSVHRLVYETFNGEIPEGMEVNHKDENPQNNVLSNLNLLSHRANMNWGTRNERISKSQSKPVIQKSLQGEVIRVWTSAHEVERQFRYSQSHISACCRGKIKTAYKYIWQYEEAV